MVQMSTYLELQRGGGAAIRTEVAERCGTAAAWAAPVMQLHGPGETFL